MSNLRIVSDDDEFQAIIKEAGDDLVIIDFFTTWCRPCRTMEPVFEAMAIHYPKAMFLKVDADKCFDTAMQYKVTGVPFFVIYFNKSVVETIQGANPQELELKIRFAEIECRKAASALERSKSFAPNVNPVMSTFGKLGSVASFIDQENSHCLNDLSPTSFSTFIQGKKLVSGSGTGKILLVYSFTQKMMLQSFKIKGNPQTGPKVLRFFVNHPKILDFNIGSTLAPSQEVTLGHNDLTGERAIELRSGSFQVVTNVQIFVTCGQSKHCRIEIESLQLFGAPVLTIQTMTGVDAITTSTSSAKPSTSANANTSPRQKSPRQYLDDADGDVDCQLNGNKCCGGEASCCAGKNRTSQHGHHSRSNNANYMPDQPPMRSNPVEDRYERRQPKDHRQSRH